MMHPSCTRRRLCALHTYHGVKTQAKIRSKNEDDQVTGWVTQFLDTLFRGYFSFGRRWILAIPIAYTVLVFAVLVSAQFELVKKAFPSLPGSQAIMSSSYFWAFSIAIWVICPVVYQIVRRLPPPENRYVIAVAKFHP